MLGARLCLQNGDPSFTPLFPLLNKTNKKDMDVEVSGGDSRMRAITILYEKFINKTGFLPKGSLLILTTGGIERISLENGKVLELSRADEAAKKFHQYYGIPKEIIESLPSESSTLDNAQAVAEWCAQHKDISEIEIVTNRYHILRSWIMFFSALYEKQFKIPPKFSKEVISTVEKILKETLADKDRGDSKALEAVQITLSPAFKDVYVRTRPTAVEDILFQSANDLNKRYAKIINDNPFTQKSRRRERQGILHFLKGTYQKK